MGTKRGMPVKYKHFVSSRSHSLQKLKISQFGIAIPMIIFTPYKIHKSHVISSISIEASLNKMEDMNSFIRRANKRQKCSRASEFMFRYA